MSKCARKKPWRWSISVNPIQMIVEIGAPRVKTARETAEETALKTHAIGFS